VRIIGTDKIGEVVDIIPITNFNRIPAYRYKVWIRYSSKFMAVDERQMEIYTE